MNIDKLYELITEDIINDIKINFNNDLYLKKYIWIKIKYLNNNDEIETFGINNYNIINVIRNSKNTFYCEKTIIEFYKNITFFYNKIQNLNTEFYKSKYLKYKNKYITHKIIKKN